MEETLIKLVEALTNTTQLVMHFSPLYNDKECTWSTIHDQVAHNHKLLEEVEDALGRETEGEVGSAESDHEVPVSPQDS